MALPLLVGQVEAAEAAELWQRPEWSVAGVNLTKKKQKNNTIIFCQSCVVYAWYCLRGLAD